MTETAMIQPSLVFPCGVCGKTFDKKKSQIRHSSYCRKRARNPPRSRKRSCISCTKAKCHCDGAFPSCSKCGKKGITCCYQDSTQRQARAGKESQVTGPSQAQSLSGLIPESPLAHSYGEQPALVDEDLFPTQIQTLVDGESLTSIQDIIHEVDFMPPTVLNLHHYTHMDNSFLDNRHQIDFAHLGDFCNLGMQPVLRAPRAFTPRTMKYRQLSLIRKYVMNTLSAYPQKLLRNNDPPPFLHPRGLAENSDRDELESQPSLPAPLAACSGIVAMWSVKNPNNSAFIWRSIRTEQERLSEECHTYDDWTALAALQAICIYFILRVSEQDEDVTDFDIPLIQTMLKIAARYREIALGLSNYWMDHTQTWESWILAQSLQRTIFTIFIVDFLFDISAGTITAGDACDGSKHLLQMRLPCSKDLWRAKTRSEWEKEYVTQHQSGVEHPRFIDLMRHDASNDLSGTSLDRWMAEVDDFGMLVVSAASLADEVGFCPRL